MRLAPRGTGIGHDPDRPTLSDIAQTIAPGLSIPTTSITADEASEHYISPFMAVLYGTDAPVSSARTQQLLGWIPTHESLLADLAQGDYLP